MSNNQFNNDIDDALKRTLDMQEQHVNSLSKNLDLYDFCDRDNDMTDKERFDFEQELTRAEFIKNN